jgi:hypothetical protein
MKPTSANGVDPKAATVAAAAAANEAKKNEKPAKPTILPYHVVDVLLVTWIK